MRAFFQRELLFNDGKVQMMAHVRAICDRLVVRCMVVRTCVGVCMWMDDRSMSQFLDHKNLT